MENRGGRPKIPALIGVAIVEFSLMAIMGIGALAAIINFVIEEFDASKQNDAVTVAQSEPMGPTRRGSELQKFGPTDYQLELLRQANEKHAGTVAPSDPEGPTHRGEDLQKFGPTDYQLEILRQANAKHGLSEEADRVSNTKPAPSPVANAPEVPKVVAEAKPSKSVKVEKKTPEAVVEKAPEASKTEPKAMTTSWSATIEGDRVNLSLRTGSAYATIQWGDGSSDNVYANGSFAGTHIYETEGPHQIFIEGREFQVLSHSAAPGA